MTDSNILASNATIKKSQEEVLFNTKGQFTKEESNTHAGSANLKQLQRGILLNTKKITHEEVNYLFSQCKYGVKNK